MLRSSELPFSSSSIAGYLSFTALAGGVGLQQTQFICLYILTGTASITLPLLFKPNVIADSKPKTSCDCKRKTYFDLLVVAGAALPPISDSDDELVLMLLLLLLFSAAKAAANAASPEVSGRPASSSSSLPSLSGDYSGFSISSANTSNVLLIMDVLSTR